MLGVFLLILSGFFVYLSYWKIKRMMDLEVNMPFGLDLQKNIAQKNSKKHEVMKHVSSTSFSNKRLSIISEIEPLNIGSTECCTAFEPMNLDRKGSIESQDSAVTVDIQDDVVQTLETNPFIPPIGVILHLNI